MSKPKILLQLDPDPQPSVFDGVVAVDAGVDRLFRHGAVEPTQVRDLVHGTIFTRGPKELCNTAIFVGGSDVSAGQTLLDVVTGSFFGPMRVSVMLDANGANTTAAAAVLAAANHVDLQRATALVLAATGPVGQRVVRLLAREGANVRVGSRSVERAKAVCSAVNKKVEGASLTACETYNEASTASALEDAEVVIAAGAFGVQLLATDQWQNSELKVAIDLNAVPPVGIQAIEVTDRAVEKNNVVCYGAVGVGGTKMKIHKAAIAKLFRSNDQVLDAEEIYAIGSELASS